MSRRESRFGVGVGSGERGRMLEAIASLTAPAKEIETIIYAVEARCMAADGPVTPTLAEMTEDELRRLWQAAHKIADAGRGRPDLVQ